MQQTWLLIFLSELFWPFIHAKCYFPDGSEMQPWYAPCDKNKQVSMCCAPVQDECRSDGLCYNKDLGLFRDGCTDPSWESSSCIKLCNTGLGLDDDGKTVMDVTRQTYKVTICDNGFFVVNGSATQDKPMTLQDPHTSSIFSSITSLILSTSISISASTKSSSEIPSNSTSSVSSSRFSSINSLTLSTSISISASTKSSSAIPSSSTSSVSFSSQKAPRQIGAIAGAAVGGAGGVVALILCALIWKRHFRMKSNHRNEMLQQPAISSSSVPSGRHNRGSEIQLSEPYGHNRSGEMDGAGLTLELDPSRAWHEMH